MSMTKSKSSILRTLLPALLLAAFVVPTSSVNARRLQDQHTDNIKMVDHFAFAEGSDLAFSNDGLLVAGAAGDGDIGGIHLFKMKKTGKIKHLSFGNCPGYHADVGLYKRYAIQSVDSPSTNIGCAADNKEGLRIWDIKNPKKPRPVGFAETTHGSHNFSMVGNTGLAYVSSYNLTGPQDVDGVSIVDIKKNPRKPKVTFLEFPDADSSGEREMKNESGAVPASMGCHDIGIDMKQHLAFCAAITETQIWDIKNPRDPVIIEILYNPLINIHHSAIANSKGDILIIGDEFGGAAAGGVACSAPGAPTGALWFYDISDPTNPQLLSWWSPPDVNPTDEICTSHFYNVWPNKDWVVTSWYTDGLFVLDFSDPSSPEMIARYEPEDAIFWSSYIHKGYIYANSYSDEKTGGVYVFKMKGE